MMNPLRSLLNLLRRKPPIAAGDIYNYAHPDPDSWQVVVDKADRCHVRYTFLHEGGRGLTFTSPTDSFLDLYRKANQ